MLRNRKVVVNILITAALIMNILLIPVVSAYENPAVNWPLKKSASHGGVNAYTAATIGRFTKNIIYHIILQKVRMYILIV